jgi:hypothetical protein
MDEGRSLGALASLLTPGGGQQSEACGLTNLAAKCVEQESAIVPFYVPIIWNWFVNIEQQEKRRSIFLKDASNVRWNYTMVWMGAVLSSKIGRWGKAVDVVRSLHWNYCVVLTQLGRDKGR